jgi:cytochrome c-type biogenesis protein CcmF
LWLRLLLATIGTAIAIVAVGTIRPLATIGPAADRVAVAPRFFAMFTGPLALLLLATMGIGQAIAAGSPGRLQDLARRPPVAYVAAGAIGAAMVAAATLAGAWRSPIGSIGVLVAVASAVTALVSGWGRVSPPSLVVHLGFALLSLGVAGSVSTVSTAQTIETGETAALAGYQVTLLDVGAERPSGDDADDPDVEAEIVARVRLVGHGQEFDAEPKLVGFRRQRTVLSETVLATAMADTQIALRNADDEGRALIEVSRKPLVNLVWAGAGVMLAGIAASSLARRRPPTRSS